MTESRIFLCKRIQQNLVAPSSIMADNESVGQSESRSPLHPSSLPEIIAMLTTTQAMKRAFTLESFYGKDEAFRIAKANKLAACPSYQPRDTRGRFMRTAFFDLEPTLADFWADVELVLQGERPENLELGSEVRRILPRKRYQPKSVTFVGVEARVHHFAV